MKEKGTRKYKSYRLCGERQTARQNAWMLHRRDAITTDNDGLHKISNENTQILGALEGTITNHKL